MLTRDSLKIPRDWEIWAGGDTGTYMGGLICAIDPNYELYALDEFPNYRYTGDGTIELVGMTVGEWFRDFGTSLRHYTKQSKNKVWVDANTTFKTEVSHGIRFMMNRKDLVLRTEILREYIRNGRLHIMPWLKVLPYELEQAHYPEEESGGSGRFARIKKKDHTLDGLEHIASRRPHPKFEESHGKPKTGIQALLAQHQKAPTVRQFDSHMGQN